ncbi:MAG TPA: glycosyltransferase family 4 protein [Stellaceae bacterium]
MADVVMADDGIAFDGTTAEAGPLGGAETAFVALAEALAARGHRVEARSNCRAALCHKDVAWAPLAGGVPDRCDLYIGNRGDRVIGLVPRAGRRLFWLHNPGRYLRKPRFLWPLLRYRPILVTTGEYHAQSVPAWLPCAGRVTIPYGMLDLFRQGRERDMPPPPIAVFASNPLRGLDWLLDLWVWRIAPAVPEAELHIYAGAAVYRGIADDRAGQMEAVLARADASAGKRIWRHPPVGREALAQILGGARVMLYRGDPGETFCLALAEAQAMGVPAVVQPIGCVVERVIDGETGHIAATDAVFAEAAVTMLRDDDLWPRYHRAALAHQRGLSWDAVAAKFEALM